MLARDRGELERLFQTLTERIAFLMRGGDAETLGVSFPPADSGILGPSVIPDNLTITVAVGASLFDDRYGLARLKPRQLIEMAQFPNDALDEGYCHGDLLLQICSNTAETNIHALRDIVKHTPSALAPRWKIDGFLPAHTLRKLGKETVRNLLGFKDGTANLDASDDKLMQDIVWVGDSADEPSWTKGGSYQVVRIIRMFVERWDRTALYEQQTIIGREKTSGAPLGGVEEHETPDYADDPKGERVPAHRPYPARQSAHGRDRGEPHSPPPLQLFARAFERRAARHGPAVRLLPVRSRRRLPRRPVAPERRAARGIHQADRRRLFLRAARRSERRRHAV